ncbi:hypothetical protein L249_1826 [Ophiocordyceps polyrhachis-furcata BCC 54312]|uniref:HhH-GPD domain-containing protein n=1 Tax=Ophiocordyceps polyrhachis-furcata BCC 54312 TaxID=1330021 RepID=A0A367LRJ4_9HYPO|nr:hypothetical protein L249_1826 [Ophiocordyceps polyrhachis-furcata BCC 54312]
MAVSTITMRRSSRIAKQEEANDIITPIKRELSSSPSASSSTPKKKKKKKKKHTIDSFAKSSSSKKPSQSPPIDKESQLRIRKLKPFFSSSSSASSPAHHPKSPFPNWPRPTPVDCAAVHKTLATIHGDRLRPEERVPAAPATRAGCGDSPSVLDALVRTILSQNTSDGNSSRAKMSMDDVYGASDRWEAIVRGGREKLERAIRSGGLSVVKSGAIMGLLRQVKERHGVYSLDHLFEASDEEAMRQMLSFKGVGPKTASCVLLFCLGRSSFAVDTHVYRLTGLLGWRPPKASREEAQAHLDALIPAEEKYPLHVLFIVHGKRCPECRAGGKSLGQCELRKLFRLS